MYNRFEDLLEIDFNKYKNIHFLIGTNSEDIFLPMEILYFNSLKKINGYTNFKNTLFLLIDGSYNKSKIEMFTIRFKNVLKKYLEYPIEKNDTNELFSDKDNFKLIFLNFNLPTYAPEKFPVPFGQINPIGMKYTKMCNIQDKPFYPILFTKLNNFLSENLENKLFIISDAIIYGNEIFGQNVLGRWFELFCELGFIIYNLKNYSEQIYTNIPNMNERGNSRRLEIIPLKNSINYWNDE